MPKLINLLVLWLPLPVSCPNNQKKWNFTPMPGSGNVHSQYQPFYSSSSVWRQQFILYYLAYCILQLLKCYFYWKPSDFNSLRIKHLNSLDLFLRAYFGRGLYWLFSSENLIPHCSYNCYTQPFFLSCIRSIIAFMLHDPTPTFCYLCCILKFLLRANQLFLSYLVIW